MSNPIISEYIMKYITKPEWVISIIATLLLSLVVPVGIFNGRNNIRVIRREIVAGLESMFEFAKDDDGHPIVIPSFELIKYKYDPEIRRERNEGRDPHTFGSYFFPVSIYILLCFMGLAAAFVLDHYLYSSFSSFFKHWDTVGFCVTSGSSSDSVSVCDSLSQDVKSNMLNLQMINTIFNPQNW